MAKSHGAEKALREAGSGPGEALREDLAAREADQEAFDFGPNVMASAIAHKRSALALTDPQPLMGKGRPKGAKGKATKQLLDALAHMGHKDSLVAASEVVTGGFLNLAQVLGVSKKDGFDRWMQVVQFLAGYQHQKAPLQINAEGIPAIPIQIGVFSSETIRDFSQYADAEMPEVAQIEGRTDEPTH